MGKLIELAERAERATADEQHAILDEAWDLLGPIVKWRADQARRFGMMIEAEAYESAAMQLVPEGCRLASFGQHREGWWEAIIVTPAPGDDGYVNGKASEGALALCASSLRARDGGEGL